MPGNTLQKQFRGLSDFTGLYTGGIQPMQLNNVIQPTMNVEDFMEEPRWSGTSVNLNTIAVGGQWAIGTVPDNEVWRVWWMGLSPATAWPAVTTVMRPTAIDPGALFEVGLDAYLPANLSTLAGSFHPMGIYMHGTTFTGGWQLGFKFALKPAGAYPIATGGIQYTRISV